jgi:glycosyltransferase involved in cell wall biosynthesis
MDTLLPHISICIPAYQRIAYVSRLLHSIEKQLYKNFEVIITDDSPDDRIKEFVLGQRFNFSIQYYKNVIPRGTPANWMEGLKYAKGEWIKIIHDDDWLTDEHALSKFADAISPDVDCIFCGYVAFYERQNISINKTISQHIFKQISRHPYRLFASNLIGPPSVLMFRKGVRELYDPALKWLVDIEAYVRMIGKYRCTYIDMPLITMSYNDTQVTNACFRNPDIEIREALIYYQKHGRSVFEGWISYDGWWRLMRNLNICTLGQLKEYAGDLIIPDELIRIIRFQRFLPFGFIKKGFFSKIFMFLSYSVNCIRGFRYHH